MLYKVGDKVRVRRDLEAGEWYRCLSGGISGGIDAKMDATDEMAEYAGEVIEITGISSNGLWYFCAEVSSYLKWSDEMFEAVPQKKSEITEEEKSVLYTKADDFFDMLTEELS